MQHRVLALAASVLIASTATADPASPIVADPALGSVALASGARTTKLVGSEIYARTDDIGEISDVIVDLQSGRVRAVIIAINGLWGDRLVAVPSASIKVGIENRLTVDASVDQLKALPEFQHDEKSAQE